MEKIDVQTKQSFQKKRKKKKRPTENNIQEREQTRKMFQDTRIKQEKEKLKKERQTCKNK